MGHRGLYEHHGHYRDRLVTASPRRLRFAGGVFFRLCGKGLDIGATRRYALVMGDTPWKALRESARLSQREVERRLEWKRGHLSLIERGLPPSEIQAQQLRDFYRDALLSETIPSIVA